MDDVRKRKMSHGAAATDPEGGGAAAGEARSEAEGARIVSDTVPDTPSILPGVLIGGRYEIQATIARGGMGTVYSAVEQETRRSVAIKILHPDVTPQGMTAERFRREARFLDAIDHQGVVGIRDCGEMDDGSIFVVMELLSGETLRDRIRRESPMEPLALVPVVRGLCDALAEIHVRGLVHRDLKPSNVFLTSEGGVKLIDFGVARAVDIERLTMTGQIVGTPRYMAPEQLRGEKNLDGRTDIYALGVVLYRALAGRPAFIGEGLSVASPIISGQVEPIRSIRPDVPANVADVVARAMAVDRDGRYATARELCDAFSAAAEGRALVVRPKQTAPLAGSADARGIGNTVKPASVRPPATRSSTTADATPTGAPVQARAGMPPVLIAGLLMCGIGVGVIGTLGIQSMIGGDDDALSADAPREPIAESASVPTPPDAPEPEPGAATVTSAAPLATPTGVLAAVEITTDPAGAMVFRDGDVLGSTPLSVPFPATATEPWELDLQMPGYHDARVRLEAGGPDSVHVDLEPEPRRRAGGQRAAATMEVEAATATEPAMAPTAMMRHTMVVDPWNR